MKPVRILVLPGIGDIYWVAVALEDWCAQRGLGPISLSVWDFDGRRRGKDFVDRLPFVASCSYFNHPPHPHKAKEFQQSYRTGEQSVFPSFLGFDYYIAVNGALRNGRTVEETLEAKTNWYLPELRRTPRENGAMQKYMEVYGRYIVTHFSDFGMFKPWVTAWGLDGCAKFCTWVAKGTDARILLTGCEWDRPFAQAVAKRVGPGAVMLAGKTLPDTFYGMLRGATGVAGWCGGNTIFATALRKPTIIGWSIKEFPNEAFFRTACPPDTGETYWPFVVERDSPRVVADRFIAMVQQQSLMVTV